jgi:hypothetical protein
VTLGRRKASAPGTHNMGVGGLLDTHVKPAMINTGPLRRVGSWRIIQVVIAGATP